MIERSLFRERESFFFLFSFLDIRWILPWIFRILSLLSISRLSRDKKDYRARARPGARSMPVTERGMYVLGMSSAEETKLSFVDITGTSMVSL